MCGAPGLREARAAALPAVAQCALRDGDADPGWRVAEVGEGVTRRTAAAEAAPGGAPEPLATGLCGGGAARDAAEALRESVAAASAALTSALDSALSPPAGAPLMRSAGEGSGAGAQGYGSFAHLRSKGTTLEHFHVYTAEEGAEAGEGHHGEARGALHEHVDAGLLIVMVPALAVDATTGLALPRQPPFGAGLSLAATPGAPLLPAALGAAAGDGGDCTLVLAGAAAERWLPEAASLRGARHSVAMPETGGRAWYGRMLLPPPDALVVDDGGVERAYEAHRAEAAASLAAGQKGSAPRGLTLCGNDIDAGDGTATARRALADEGSCSGERKYCWQSCQPVADLPCGMEAQCVTGSGEPYIFPQTCHDCKLVCPPPPPPAESEDDSEGGDTIVGPTPTSPGDYFEAGFCNTRLPPVSMWMDGFRTGGDGFQPCLVVLFRGWVISSTGQLAGYCVLSLFMGAAVELIVAARRRLATGDAQKATSKAAQAADAALYGAQLLLGYWLMLIAMTYQGELFACVILGLLLGYAALNRPAQGAPVSGSAEACCRSHTVRDGVAMAAFDSAGGANARSSAVSSATALVGSNV